MLRQLSSILPPAVLADAEITAAKLLPALLMRTNFIPGVRQRLGWRGVKECPTEGVSVKIAGKEGIYGFSLAGTQKSEKQGIAIFDLHYFPTPEEDFLEAFSVAACIAALQPDYLDQVRKFTSHARLKQLFHIAQLKLIFDPDSATVELSIQAADRLVLVSGDGVTVTKDNKQEQIVAPGEIDQSLAAFCIALAFFRIMAASFSFCLELSPSHLRRSSRDARQFIYFKNNRVEQKPLPGTRETILSLTWGIDSPLSQVDQGFVSELLWHPPMGKPVEYEDEGWWQNRVPGARFSLDKSTMGITDRPKLIILTGFLGAGKTSFLNHFIEYQAQRNAFVAIVQNEIGAKSLDTHLLGQHYAVTEMDEGCICCTLSGNLKLALAEISSSFQPDFVVVETTGLANPANFLNEVSELEDQLSFCSITTVIDASQGISALQKYGVAHEQVILADVILLNKANSLPTAELMSLIDDIEKLNPVAAIHHGSYGDFSIPELYGVNLTGEARLADSLKRINNTCHHTHSSHNISSILVEFKHPLDKNQFLAQTTKLSNKVLRIKGVMQFTDNEDSFYYQYVPGSHSLTPTDNEAPNDNFLVVIGEDIENSACPLLSLATA